MVIGWVGVWGEGFELVGMYICASTRSSSLLWSEVQEDVIPPLSGLNSVWSWK